MTAPTAPLFSSNWYRVSGLRPRLRGHVRIHRHAYRNQVWFVVEDRVAGKYHRFNPASFGLISLMDGKRSLDGAWKRLTEELAEDTPSQDDVINLLGQLHAADLIQCDVDPDVAELLERNKKQRRRKYMSRYLNPLSLRFPLWDPDRFLDRTKGLLKPVSGWGGVLLWLAVVVPVLVLVPAHWPDLTENFTEQLLSFDNILVMTLVFPLIKAMHELGHGYVAKIKGGEVHEMGIMLLVLFPVPYVDASSSSAFVKKTDRMLVGAAGILTELFIAALAFYLWLMLEPGLARSMAYNAIVLASVTTLLFNANPLLRYDGYYVLADWAEIPNLGTRSNKYWQYLADRYLFGVKQAEAPHATAGERRWFIGYAPLAFVYRIFVLFSIALFIAQEYFIVGVLLALWGLVASLGIPIYKGFAALRTQPRYAAHTVRIRGMLIGILTVVLTLLFIVPVSYHTHAEGVVWLPEQAILRAGSNGFVARLLAQPGDTLRPGQAVLESYAPSMSASLEYQAARVEEARARYDAAWVTEPVQAAQLKEEVRRELAGLDRIQDEISHLTLRAEAAGSLLLQNPDDLPGRFLKKGEVVGYVVGQHTALARVVVPQSDVDQVRLATSAVEVKLPQRMQETWSARVVRAVPGAAKELPSPALGQGGGGQIPMDPRDEKGLKTLESLFEFEVELPDDAPAQFLGSRVYVRFEHPAQPIGVRWLHGVRRLFLSYFEI